jgi:hypothetical protein
MQVKQCFEHLKLQCRRQTQLVVFVYLAVRRVADYLNVHNKLDIEDSVDGDRPPPLLTRQVLAKFRSLEEESRSGTHQQVPLQRQRVRLWMILDGSFFRRFISF